MILVKVQQVGDRLTECICFVFTFISKRQIQILYLSLSKKKAVAIRDSRFAMRGNKTKFLLRKISRENRFFFFVLFFDDGRRTATENRDGTKILRLNVRTSTSTVVRNSRIVLVSCTVSCINIVYPTKPLYFTTTHQNDEKSKSQRKFYITFSYCTCFFFCCFRF